MRSEDCTGGHRRFAKVLNNAVACLVCRLCSPHLVRHGVEPAARVQTSLAAPVMRTRRVALHVHKTRLARMAGSLPDDHYDALPIRRSGDFRIDCRSR